MVAYLVQVDEAGHMYGGDSPSTRRPCWNTDENLGAILAWRTASSDMRRGPPCEDWTVIVVTDHGHQPQPGFGHGFQSPVRRTTFVIVDGPQFDANCRHEAEDSIPTTRSSTSRRRS